MTEEAVLDTREMAPKRRRMMDMVLVLGGLKEDSAIPPSRVGEEMAALKREIEPLIKNIIAFPNTYYEKFLRVAEKIDLSGSIKDRGIVTEALTSLRKAMTIDRPAGIEGLENLLASLSRHREAGQGEASTAESQLNPAETVQAISQLIPSIETALAEFEEKAKADAEAARGELTEIVGRMLELAPKTQTAPEEALDDLQKLGTRTRYGPFLRASAQVKRGRREGRIDEQEFSRLVEGNVMTELRRGIVMFILDKMGSRTVIQLADLMRVPSDVVQREIVSMVQRGEIEMVGVEEAAPVFARVLSETPQTSMVLKRVIQQLRGAAKSLDEHIRTLLQKALDRMQLVYERLQIMGQYDEARLSEIMNQLRENSDRMTQAVLGSKTSESAEDLRLLIAAGLEAFAKFNLKIALEKGPSLVSGTNAYGEKLDKEKYEKLLSTYLDNEVERGTLLVLIRELGAVSALELAKRTRIPQDRVFRHLLKMKRDELLVMAGESHGYVLYDVPRTPTETEITIRTVSDLALQLMSAKSELMKMAEDLKPGDIGRLATSLETISKARDKLARIRVGGKTVAEELLAGLESQVKSAVGMAYRTRAKMPSTRPKVTIQDLMEVDVPSVLDEYRDMMGYAPLLGFGTVNWDNSKCLGCKSCEIACPEDAIFLKPTVDVPKFFEMSSEQIDKLPVNKSMFYKTVRGLATRKPIEKLVFATDKPGFGTVEVDLWLCVACRTCVRRCPGPESGALELELKWSLPDVVRHLVAAEE